jgi:hypothetical protein
MMLMIIRECTNSDNFIDQNTNTYIAQLCHVTDTERCRTAAKSSTTFCPATNAACSK